MQGANVQRGLTRGWIVLSAVWWAAILVFSVIQIVGEPPCYAFDSITLDDSYKGPNSDFVKNLREQLLKTDKICGLNVSTDLLGIERYAQQGAISQVAFAWLDPGGWSTKTNATLDVLEKSEITVSRILHDVRTYVYKARTTSMLPWIFILLFLPFPIFAIGSGIYWTIKGFASTPRE
jgi:hypothetical protein